ncbi:methyltransferase family protein [Lutibacter oceani]|uniref:Methyltransferase family protein n=1 Tax=Lutibacter oceani TaxID=1853311 RepID=A0A3D9RQD0_9FLAO|nr:class I SAM-dependent methyltransferase [Lutibacter oceani]REE81997.1 methyltransferase family protein [Lutibacter oceani]
MLNLKRYTKEVLNRLPYIKGLYKESQNFKKHSCYRPGHYYSPIVSIEEIKKRENEIWNCERIDSIDGINLRTKEQIKLISHFNKFYSDIPFKKTRNKETRYFFENGLYSYTDGIILYSMIRYIKPKQIIEVGSGFSSSVMLDTNQFFFDNQIKLTFIEPYPERIYSLLKEDDKDSSNIIVDFVQNIDIEVFKQLDKGDILFIDSSHVVKTGSDVHFILFEILPKLKEGVYIHFHDIFYPFEYPKEWVYKGRNWNENYFLKAFLMYNNDFQIEIFSNYLHTNYEEAFKNMPLCYNNRGGNLWLKKII